MERILIGKLEDHVGKTVSISGWVDVARDQGKMAFFDFRDRSGKVQGVVFGKPEVLEIAQSLRPEWVVTVEGIVNQRPEKMVRDVQNGTIELEITKIDIVSVAETLPFDSDAELNLDTLLDYRPLTLRRDRERAIFKVQAEITSAYRDFLNSENFIEFQAPKLVGNDAEGGGNIFKVEYFKDKDAYLSTSPQLYKQIMVGVFEKVFSIGNVFRAEKHSTTRHLNEYTSLDMEMGFIEDHTDIMQVEEKFMRFLSDRLEESCADEFKALEAEIPRFGDSAIPSMTLSDAQALITKETGNDCEGEPDLDPEHERWLSEWAKRKHDSDFVFITHYPVSKRPFYTYEDEQMPGFTKSFDLLFRGVEITTGGQRIHNYESLTKALENKGLDIKNFSFYMQSFAYGMPAHGGWGMGLERLTQKLLGLDNVKEATLFPRDMNRIDTLLSTPEED